MDYQARASQSSTKVTATKLFTYLLCHADECRLDLPSVKKRLDKFTGSSINQRDALVFVKSFPKKFEVKTVDSKQFVEAKTSVKLCDAYQERKCQSPNCKQLHICRFFLQGSCKFDEKCKKTHSFDSPETRRLLLRHKLDHLPLDAMKKLFKKVLSEKIIKHTSERSGPEPCKFYNKGVCKNGDQCGFLHVCEHYVEDDCKFGGRCKRVHHFETHHSRKVLAAHSLGGVLNETKILSFLRSGHLRVVGQVDLNSSSDSDDDFISYLQNLSTGKKIKPKASGADKDSRMASEAAHEKLEICGFNLRGKCQYGAKCNARHTRLPYEWQYTFGSTVVWMSFSLEENRKIEKTFCDVNVSCGQVTLNEGLICEIDFQKISGKMVHDAGIEVKIRRLSTVSSVLAASGHVFRTKWKWYWLDEHKNWQSYDDGKTSVTSETIEHNYQSESGEKKNTFSVASNKYTLFFDDPNQLYQQNDKYGTKRDVRRRPAQFLDDGDMKTILEEFKKTRQRTSSSSGGTSESQYSIPSHWTPVDPSEEFKLVDLSEVVHHEEFTKVKTKFFATMAGYKIKSVKRVQNVGLWEDYERQKSKMKKANSGNPPEERWLFHGTNKDTVDPICQQGFDWRLSGKHGTRYGKGSYFAADATYSNAYSKSSDCNPRMFMATVLVGSFVLGDYSMQRPPSKIKSNPLSVLHDSCVNDVTKPSIFVVFERCQAYPYYVIEYGK